MLENCYIKSIKVNSVFHLHDFEISIPITGSDQQPTNLVLTGKNGSGKTSILKAIVNNINNYFSNNYVKDLPNHINAENSWLKNNPESRDRKQHEQRIETLKKELEDFKCGVEVFFNTESEKVREQYKEGRYVIAYLDDFRVFKPQEAKHIEATELKEVYQAEEKPHTEFIKYVADLWVKEALYEKQGKQDNANEITQWFVALNNSLKTLFSDPSIKLDFDPESYKVIVKQNERLPYELTQFSSGYAAAVDIVVEIMLRMQKAVGRQFVFSLPGIVFIDEIETHLHLELQRKIMGFLCKMFPNVQFIITTHSPFILNSTPNAVAYDLERKQLITEGLCDLSYSGIVDGYFNVEEKSQELIDKYRKYNELTAKEKPSDEDYSEIARLEQSLDEIPDYLMSAFTAEYARRKLEFWNKQ